MSLSASGTNNGFVGAPLFLLLIPESAGLAIGMSMLVDNVVIIPAALILFQAASGRGAPLGRRIGGIARSVLTHPLIIAIALGLILLLPALGLPGLAPELAAAALLTCALPSMSIAAALAEQHGEGEFGAAALLLSTVASFPTLTAWLFVVGALGWLPF
ncbi:hypothetical protein [Kocuria palustris]|uniref:hypothetical protein n=1 Tax=Kocuria palustris TaxID=71999 RepID=UPI002042F38D|nr:hypothetical protein [Kocuria palustris]MCM3332615.1 hypothetical protein [Kocuria palustris]